VNDPYSPSSVSGRTERRVIDFFNKSTVDTIISDLVFTNTTYYGKIYEFDTQGFVNQGSGTVALATAFNINGQRMNHGR